MVPAQSFFSTRVEIWKWIDSWFFVLHIPCLKDLGLEYTTWKIHSNHVFRQFFMTQVVQTNVKIKSGARKWPAGYQPSVCCMLTWTDGEPPPPITSLAINSKYGLWVAIKIHFNLFCFNQDVRWQWQYDNNYLYSAHKPKHRKWIRSGQDALAQHSNPSPHPS